MEYLFDKLKWTVFMTSSNLPYTELDQYADITFPNGVEGRIVTGKMADTRMGFPYELNIVYPKGDKQRHERLDKKMVNDLLNRLKAIPPSE